MFDLAKLREIIDKSKFINSIFSVLFCRLFVFLLRFLREPAFANTFALLEKFEYRPETRETEDAEQHWKIDVFHKERAYAACNSEDEKHRPTLDAEMVFALDDDRVEQADAKKCPQPEYDAVKIHNMIRLITNSM